MDYMRLAALSVIPQISETVIASVSGPYLVTPACRWAHSKISQLIRSTGNWESVQWRFDLLHGLKPVESRQRIPGPAGRFRFHDASVPSVACWGSASTRLPCGPVNETHWNPCHRRVNRRSSPSLVVRVGISPIPSHSNKPTHSCRYCCGNPVVEEHVVRSTGPTA